MNIVVIGCGHVGAALVRDLERIGHDISLVVQDPDQLKRLDSFDDLLLPRHSPGGGAPPTRMCCAGGGVETCDAVAAVSGDDAVNLMACQIAQTLFQRKKVICRVSDPHLQLLYHKC